MATHHLSHVTPADYIRLGPAAAAIKAKTSTGRWKQIVRAAHGQGWTVASALDPNTPASLKQRTNKSISTAAQRQVKEAYAPAYAELDTAGAQAEGMRQKRLSDQTSFDQWSAQKASEIAAGVNAAQKTYLDTIKTATDARIADAQNTAATFASRAGAGGISDLSGSVAQADVTRNAQTAQEQARNVQAAAVASTPVAAQRAAAIPLADLGGATQRRAQIEGDFSKTMNDIFTGRLKLNTARAKDQIGAYTDLLKTEMDKASANRDFTGLQAQLQTKADIAESQHQDFLTGQKGLDRRAKLGANVTLHGQNLSHQDRVSQQRATETQKALDRANKLAIAAANATARDQSKANGPAAQKASRGQVQAINSLASMIRAGVIVGPDGKRHKLTSAGGRSAMMGILGATKGQIDVATRIAQGRHTVLYNAAALGILPGDVALLR